MSETVACLDKGFVQLIEVNPISNTENAIVAAARVSYANDLKDYSEARNIGLIKFMYENAHTTPFEMITFKFLICLPLSIATQFIRHRTANINAMSHRYTPAGKVFEGAPVMSEDSSKTLPWFVPVEKIEDVRYQSSTNFQASSEQVNTEEELFHKFQEMEQHTQAIYRIYEELLEAGVSREQARFYLPCATYTRMYYQMNLHNLLHMLKLRMAADAQPEIQVYAKAMYSLIQPYVPNVCSIFEETKLNALTLTQPEIQILQNRTFPKQWSRRRKDAFVKKLKTLDISIEEFSEEE